MNETPKKVGLWVGVGVLVLGAAIVGGRMYMGARTAATPVSLLTEGTEFRDCATCPVMRVLAPATFKQGTPAETAGALPFEQPAHDVTIAYALAAGVHEITVGQYSEFVKEYPRERKGCATYDVEWKTNVDVSWRNATSQQDASFPVTCVSWQDASDYAAWLSLRTGQTYRLPSASEWEYFAQSGSPSVPWTHTEDACEHANAADTTAARRYPGWTGFPCADGFVEAAPVGTFAPNAFGLTDTLGNVFEWVQDCWRDDYANAPADGSVALDGNCDEHEARGGSWFTTPAFVRAGYRNRFAAAYRSNSLGFRLVRELKES